MLQTLQKLMLAIRIKVADHKQLLKIFGVIAADCTYCKNNMTIWRITNVEYK